MKKVLLALTVVCLALGQTPNFTSSSPSVRISLMALTLNVTSNRASVNCEIHFRNDGAREAEAELTLPLPEGVSVSRYYLDINGVMRQAVPVSKDKGKQVFEALEQKKVDPGLLEKTETGNSFRTRIYPVPVGGIRKIIIGYDQELDNIDGFYIYKVLSEYSKPVDTYSVNISVVSKAGASIQIDDGENVTLKLDSTIYHYNMIKNNYMPKRILTVKVPSQKSTTITKKVQDTIYFYTVIDTSALVKTAELIDKIPYEITLIWDDSLSTKNRNIEDELKFLDEYFLGQSSKVTVYLLNYEFTNKDEFIVTNGQCSALKKVLSQSKYDGGTRFNQIKLQQKSTVLFFTDGISSLSNSTFDLPKDTILSTISSTTTADHAYLNYVSNLNSGVYINLKSLTPSQGARMLKTKSTRFQGIQETTLINEVYPLKGTPIVKSSFSITGIALKSGETVVLLFGPSSDNIIKRISVVISTGTQSTIIDVQKVWAARKIESLQYDYNKNKQQIEKIGKKYSIVTKGTSLIVLETVSDYIRYGIIPPQELREQFDRLSKQQLLSNLSTKVSNWKQVDSSLKMLKDWWTNPRVTAPIYKPSMFLNQENVVQSESVSISAISTATIARAEVAPTSAPASGQGAVAPPAQPSQTIDSKVVSSSRPSTDSASSVSGGSPAPSSDANSAPQQKSVETGGSVNVINILSKRPTPVLDLDSPSAGKKKDESDTSTKQLKEEKSKQRVFSSQRPYMKSIEEASDKYKAYLQLRQLNLNNPTFYLDVAIYMFERDHSQALKILSNIAQLSLQNHYLYKTLTYLFKQFGSKEDCLYTATKVATWRSFEPQAHRDLALALELNDRIQEAASQLVEALQCSFYPEMSRIYSGVEDVILLDIDRIVSEHNSSIFEGKLDSKYYQTRLPLDLRVILNWNQMDVDIDLHVIDPNNEECYYAHKQTQIGGKYFKDFTAGYGPQQFTLKKAIKGKYIIKTNFFGQRKLTDSGPVTIQVEIYQRQSDGTINKKYKTVTAFHAKDNQEIAIVEVK